MLATQIIFLVDEAEWVNQIVVQNKKESKEIWVSMDYRNLNCLCAHDPFPTPFSDEVLDNVVGNEAFSFTYRFSSYHQVSIAKEEKKKTKFVIEWGSYAYHVLCFGLENATTLFLRIIIAAFWDYIHRFIEVHMDDWLVYSFLKIHSNLLLVMFAHCRQL